MHQIIARTLFAALAALCLALAIAAQQPTPVERSQPVLTTPPVSDAKKRLDSFELVWKTVNEKFYDPRFGGVDWNKVHERYAPLVSRATSDQEFHLLLQQMLNELHQSHFVIIPKEAIPGLRHKHKSTPNAAGIDTANDADEMDEPDEDDAGEAVTPLDRIGYKVTERLSTGIGIDLRVIRGAAVITRVQPGSTGARSGLRPGFVIKSVSGESMDLAITRLEQSPIFHSLLRAEIPAVLLAEFVNGEENSQVQLVYLDGQNRRRTASVTREKLNGQMSAAIGNLPALYTEFESRRLAGDFAYIRFNAFVPILMKKTCAALREMHDARGLIIDLRGNQGGLLGMVSGLTGLLETTPVMLGEIKTRTGSNPIVAFPQRVAYTGPIVILVDGTTQSAGEMFAGALQEAGRAIVVGEQSAGNMLPSVIVKLPTGALFQYGFGNYLTLTGNALEGRGVIPNINVGLSRLTLLRGADQQMVTATRKLRELTAPVRVHSFGTVRVTAGAARSSSSDPALSTQSPPVVVTDHAPENDDGFPEPPPVRPLPTSAATPVTPGLPSVDQVIDHYLEAIGGRAALDKLTSRVSKGTVQLASEGLSGYAEIYEQAPNRSSLLINIDGLGLIQQTFDGTDTWLQDPLRGYIKFPRSVSDRSRNETEFHREVRMKELNPGLTVVGKERLGDRETYVLQSPPFGVGAVKWYFDVEDGLLLRKGTIYFEDYRNVDGVRLPFRIRDDSEGAASVVRLIEIKHNVAIDEAKFAQYPDCFTEPEPVQRGEHKDVRHRP
jgi:carboxyl-terminal processing protease